MLRNTSRRPGFTLIELLVVVCVIGILIALLLPALAKARAASRRNAAKATMSTIAMALEKYRDDFKYYPPEDKLGAASLSPTLPDSGSKVLAYYLCQKFTDGEMHFGPYLDLSTARLKDGDKVISPLSGFYRYKIFADANGTPQSYQVVDSGEDRLLGLDANLQPDNSDANGDGIPDDKDNIYSSDPGQ